jgi:hypothetical protein
VECLEVTDFDKYAVPDQGELTEILLKFLGFGGVAAVDGANGSEY